MKIKANTVPNVSISMAGPSAGPRFGDGPQIIQAPVGFGMGAEKKPGDLYVVGEIEESLIHSFFTQAKALIKDRNKYKKPKPINVFINSGGGDALIGMALARFMADSPVPFRTIAIGCAASAAGLMYLGGTERIMMPGSWLMYHDASTISWANDGEHHEREALMHKALDDQMVKFVSHRTGVPVKTVKKECSKNSWWISEIDALSMNFSTHVYKY